MDLKNLADEIATNLVRNGVINTREQEVDAREIMLIGLQAHQVELVPAAVADPPWSVIMANLDAAIAKGQGIRRQALLDAATAICQAYCSWESNPAVYVEHAEGWMHPDDAGRPRADCNAGPIHDLIAQMEKARQ